MGMAVAFATWLHRRVPNVRLGVIGTSSSVPGRYPGTLSPAGSQIGMSEIRGIFFKIC